MGFALGFELPERERATSPPTAASVPIAKYSEAILRPATTLV
jgi:hypothetical protein